MANDTGGNVKVDFVWGNIPMQPDDARTDGTPVVVVANNAAQNKSWSGYTTYPSGVLNAALDNHVNAVANYNGFPDYTPVAPFLDAIDQVAVPDLAGLTSAAAKTALEAVGLVRGTVTGASGVVTVQSIAAGVLANLGTAVNITIA